MRHVSVVTAVSAFALAAALPLSAQMAPAPAPKPTSLQITGGAMFPVFSYADYTKGTGWKGVAALVIRRNAYYSIRLEGEYNTVGGEDPSFSGATFLVYGGGIGGGRVVARGNVQQEGYFVAGAYEWDGQTALGDYKELQFGTKIGTNAVFGSGKAKFVLDFHWLYTWSEPYTNMLAITAGLRF